jgi:hypothetical protein
MPFKLESPAFAANGSIPERHVQKGANVSPALKWSGLPDGAKSLVLIVEDPDAPVGTVTHWAAYDIDPSRSSLPQAASDLTHAANDMGHARYDGPKPPPGHGPHRYHFRLDVPEGCAAVDMKKAARSHVIAETELIGTFETPK